jgi:hypothetical protein
MVLKKFMWCLVWKRKGSLLVPWREIVMVARSDDSFGTLWQTRVVGHGIPAL